MDDADAVRRQHDHRQSREHHQRRREEVFGASCEQRCKTDRGGRQHRETIDEHSCIRIDGSALDLGGGAARRQREASAEQRQHDERDVADRQSAEQLQPGLCVFNEAGEAHGAEHAGLLDPDQMAVEHQHQDGAADVRLGPGKLLAPALADQCEGKQETDQQ